MEMPIEKTKKIKFSYGKSKKNNKIKFSMAPPVIISHIYTITNS